MNRKLKAVWMSLSAHSACAQTDQDKPAANCRIFADVGIRRMATRNGDVWLGRNGISRIIEQTQGTVGQYTGFITKLNSTGTALIYYTYVGGSKGSTVLGV